MPPPLCVAFLRLSSSLDKLKKAKLGKKPLKQFSDPGANEAAKQLVEQEKVCQCCRRWTLKRLEEHRAPYFLAERILFGGRRIFFFFLCFFLSFFLSFFFFTVVR